METPIDYDKWSSGVRMVIYNWPLVRGAVDVKFNEYQPKKIKALKDYIDCSKYNFKLLSNVELEILFVKELCLYIIEWDCQEQELEDVMLIFANEVFDCMPHHKDTTHQFAARYILKLFDEVQEGKSD